MLGFIAQHSVVSQSSSASLSIALPSNLNFKLYDSVDLTTGGTKFEPKGEYDSKTQRFVFKWTALHAGTYSLNVKTVFGDRQFYNLDINTDTGFVLQPEYILQNRHGIKEAHYSHAKNIRVYLASAGCFHKSNESLLIELQGRGAYKCTLTTDSVAIKDTLGRQMITKVPVSKSIITGKPFIDRLVEMIKVSDKLQNEALDNAPKCVSTSHNTMFILADNILFQFSDYGICDWEEYRKLLQPFY